jgi:hypothetical protein
MGRKNGWLRCWRAPRVFIATFSPFAPRPLFSLFDIFFSFFLLRFLFLFFFVSLSFNLLSLSSFVSAIPRVGGECDLPARPNPPRHLAAATVHGSMATRRRAGKGAWGKCTHSRMYTEEKMCVREVERERGREMRRTSSTSSRAGAQGD